MENRILAVPIISTERHCWDGGTNGWCRLIDGGWCGWCGLFECELKIDKDDEDGTYLRCNDCLEAEKLMNDMRGCDRYGFKL
ncbi:hypothetical protein FACS1894200_12940 [Spirochaetia bacterium]|nr:hypothetical protein FACS1894200_12940 [Spirochaetia bacterium]